jgi:hypothetical protein
MENNTNNIDPLLAKVEQFGRNQLELMKLQLLDKFAHFLAQLIARLLLLSIIILCFIFFSIALAIWLGTLLGAIYYGYLCIAFGYGLLAILVKYFYSHITSGANNWVVRKIFT